MSIMLVTKSPLYTALLVEDEPEVGRFVKRILAAEKAKVLTSHTGTRALQIAARNRLDLVILDLTLPDVRGTETLRRLRAIDPEVPIIMVASCGSIATVRAAMELGAFEYLTKPLDREEMSCIIHQALASRAVAPLRLRA